MECMWTVVEASDSDELQEYDEEAEEAFEGEGRVVLEHAYCKRPNGTLVDASGTQTLERIMEDFSDYGCDEDGALPVTEAELDKMMASGFLGKVHPGEIDKLVQYIKVNLGVYAEGNE